VSVAAVIASQKAEHGVPHAVSCQALGVSRSWFYKWRDRPPTRREQRRVELDAAVARIFAMHKGRYGSPRVHADLVDEGWRVSVNTVAASMARQGLVARPKRRRRGLTRADKRARKFPDLLGRHFTAAAPNLKWTGDLTEVPPRRARCTWPPPRICSPGGCWARRPAPTTTPRSRSRRCGPAPPAR